MSRLHAKPMPLSKLEGCEIALSLPAPVADASMLPACMALAICQV